MGVIKCKFDNLHFNFIKKGSALEVFFFLTDTHKPAPQPGLGSSCKRVAMCRARASLSVPRGSPKKAAIRQVKEGSTDLTGPTGLVSLLTSA